jgi:hypothetical protein
MFSLLIDLLNGKTITLLVIITDVKIHTHGLGAQPFWSIPYTSCSNNKLIACNPPRAHPQMAKWPSRAHDEQPPSNLLSSFTGKCVRVPYNYAVLQYAVPATSAIYEQALYSYPFFHPNFSLCYCGHFRPWCVSIKPPALLLGSIWTWTEDEPFFVCRSRSWRMRRFCGGGFPFQLVLQALQHTYWKLKQSKNASTRKKSHRG